MVPLKISLSHPADFQRWYHLLKFMFPVLQCGIQMLRVYPKNSSCLLSVRFHAETIVQPCLQIYNLNFPSGCHWERAGRKDEWAAFFYFLEDFLILSCSKAILKSILRLELCWISFHSDIVSHFFSFLFKISK